MMKPKIIRACTVPLSVIFVTGMLPELQKRYEVVLLSSPGHELDEAEEKYGVRGIRVPMERHISLGHDLISLCRLVYVFLRETCDGAFDDSQSWAVMHDGWMDYEGACKGAYIYWTSFSYCDGSQTENPDADR